MPEVPTKESGNMQQTYQEFYDHWIVEIKRVMDQQLIKSQAPKELITAMQYSVDAGGKRLRPIMTLAVYQAFGGNITEEIIKVACAVELIHTYSLIHDDLPAMDDDDFRRGKPTSHKKFGEAQAILAGDGLLTLAFSWLTENSLAKEVQVELVMSLAKAAGPAGMVGGQVDDMLGNDRTYTHQQLVKVHNLKTGALLSYAALAGGILARQPINVINQLALFGLNYGLAFQIQDDLLDVNDTTDLAKNTYPHLLGIFGAKTELERVLNITQATLQKITTTSSFDYELVSGLLSYFERKND